MTTTRNNPPIATRSFDWSATPDNYDGAADSPNRHHVGHGATEAEAIEDLRERFDAENVPERHDGD